MIPHLDTIPPFLCVALARKGRRRKTMVEISKDSGLNLRKVERIAARLSWGGVKLKDAAAFSKACGVDLICQAETRQYLRRQANVRNVLSHLDVRQLARFNQLMASFKSQRSTRLSDPPGSHS